MIGRIVVTDIRPQVECGRWPGRAVVGEAVPFTATVFGEGHEHVGATLVLKGDAGRAIRIPMHHDGVDRFACAATVDRMGRWQFQVEGWGDPVATWQHDIRAKLDAGQDVAVELEAGARLLDELVAGLPKGTRGAADRKVVEYAADALRDTTETPDNRARAGTADPLLDVLERHPVRRNVSPSAKLAIWVDRPRALYGSWYELFPRSEGATATRSGTLRTAAARLPAISAMGFDVVYLPPIHPIGAAFRKGRNNTLDAAPDDPGSPWAIGSADGGHDAVHPDLGTLDDFDAFVARAAELDMEVALDLALQCSPDHPWVTAHPEWFTTRADGTIAYAENPPKKYQDIYPLNFDNDPEGLYGEVLRVVRHWIAHGVRVFRVDNPHTKPLPFWERLIWEVKSSEPDVLFLSEAFTRPPMMHTLAKIGFTQSYTYFTWRNARWEIEEYLRELAHSESVDYFRPNFFVNTPDILHAYLQSGGPAAFQVRAVLASTLSPSWGVYAGYELYEGTAVRDGSEEYLDSEKYQYRPRDWSRPGLTPYLTRLNEIRHRHPALHWLRNLTFHWADHPDVLVYSKHTGDDTVLVVINLDPHNVHETTVHLDLTALGLGPDDHFEVRDELADTWYVWHGSANYVRLDPTVQVAHVFSVRPL